MNTNNETPITNEVKFNLGFDWNIKISRRIDAALNYYLNGDRQNWFFNMKAVKLLIISYLSEEEKEELLKQELEIAKIINDKYKIISSTKKIEKYDCDIKTYLNKYGFLNPIKEDNSSIF